MKTRDRCEKDDSRQRVPVQIGDCDADSSSEERLTVLCRQCRELLASPKHRGIERELAKNPIQAKLGLRLLTVHLARLSVLHSDDSSNKNDPQTHGSTAAVAAPRTSFTVTAMQQRVFARLQLFCNDVLKAEERPTLPLLHLTPMMLLTDNDSSGGCINQAQLTAPDVCVDHSSYSSASSSSHSNIDNAQIADQHNSETNPKKKKNKKKKKTLNASKETGLLTIVPLSHAQSDDYDTIGSSANVTADVTEGTFPIVLDECVSNMTHYINNASSFNAENELGEFRALFQDASPSNSVAPLAPVTTATLAAVASTSQTSSIADITSTIEACSLPRLLVDPVLRSLTNIREEALTVETAQLVRCLSAAYESELDRMRILNEECLQTLNMRLFVAQNALEQSRIITSSASDTD